MTYDLPMQQLEVVKRANPAKFLNQACLLISTNSESLLCGASITCEGTTMSRRTGLQKEVLSLYRR